MIYVQNKALKGHAENLKEKFTYSLKEANDGNLDQKENKNQLHERMGEIIQKLATLNILVRLNIQWLREEHGKDLNAAKDNGTI